MPDSKQAVQHSSFSNNSLEDTSSCAFEGFSEEIFEISSEGNQVVDNLKSEVAKLQQENFDLKRNIELLKYYKGIAEEYDKEVSKLTKKKQILEKKVKGLEAELQGKKGNLIGNNQDVERLEQEVKVLVLETQKKNDQLKDAKNEIQSINEELQQKLDLIEAELNRLKRENTSLVNSIENLNSDYENQILEKDKELNDVRDQFCVDLLEYKELLAEFNELQKENEGLKQKNFYISSETSLADEVNKENLREEMAKPQSIPEVEIEYINDNDDQKSIWLHREAENKQRGTYARQISSTSKSDYPPEYWDSLPNAISVSDCLSASNADIDLNDLNSEEDSSSSCDSDDPFPFLLEGDSLLVEKEIPLTDEGSFLNNEFYQRMKDLEEENEQEYRKVIGGNEKSIENWTKDALESIQGVVSEYLKKGIKLNSYCSDNEATVVSLTFEKIQDVLDTITDVTSGRRINYCEDLATDEENIDIIEDIIEDLLLRGGKVQRCLFYNDRMSHATTGFINGFNEQFDDYLFDKYKEIRSQLESAAYESIVNKNKKIQDELEIDIDNIYSYIKYPQGSIVEVAKITNELEIENLELKVCILEIGGGIVKVHSAGKKRNYTDVVGSSIVLTFYTNLGELDVILHPDKQNQDIIRVEVNDQDLLERLKNCKEEIGENCLLGGLSVNEAIERGFFTRPKKFCQYSKTMSSLANSSQGSQSYELKVVRPTNQQLLQDLCNIESNTIKKEKDFDTKTHLIDIFKTLHKLLEDKKNVSKTDLANAAEKKSKRLGLEGRYNWNEIFGLEKKVPQNAEQDGSYLPLSNNLYSQNKIASSVNNQVEKYHTEGQGNCFFHAVFGNNSSGVYQADKAQEMRQEWHKFLSQFESLSDPKMPQPLKEKLSLVFYNVLQEKELDDFYTSNLYKEYLNKINRQDYFIYAEEVPILASLANIEIEIYSTQKLPDKIKPNPDMINANYKGNQELWGSKEKETIYLENAHYSRAEVIVQLQKQMQEQRSFPCSSLLNCTAKKVKLNQQQLLTV